MFELSNLCRASIITDTPPESTFSVPRLQSSPNWLYLLRKIDALYRLGSDGGSGPIRSHRKRVRDRLSAVMTLNPELSHRSALQKPVTAHFPRALDLGECSAMQCDTLILGFVLFAPNTTYPQHSHQDIEESYVSISGAWSENNGAVYAPGSLIYNRARNEHRITTGDRDPCLLAYYAWVGPAERLASRQMKLTPPRKTK